MPTTLDSILTQLKALTASPYWTGVETDGYYALNYAGVDRGQRIHRRFGLLQAVFFERTGNHGDGLLDTEMAAVLGVPTEDAIQLRTASHGDQLQTRGGPEHLRGQIKAALGL